MCTTQQRPADSAAPISTWPPCSCPLPTIVPPVGRQSCDPLPFPTPHAFTRGRRRRRPFTMGAAALALAAFALVAAAVIAAVLVVWPSRR